MCERTRTSVTSGESDQVTRKEIRSDKGVDTGPQFWSGYTLAHPVSYISSVGQKNLTKDYKY